MLRVLLILMLLAPWPGQLVHGAVPGSPPNPASPQNRAPQTVSYIDVAPLYVGGSSASVNASSYFTDPDGDRLRYSVNSPTPSVATVSISGSTVTITPVKVGTTGKIIVTARDPGGLTATQDFNVTVQDPPPPNRAPEAEGTISSVTLQEGGSSATVNASSYFSDPDGDTLRYSVNSPNPSIVTTSISGSTVTITPVAAGTTGKIIVTARDPGGLTATQDFTATVEAAPPPDPVVATVTVGPASVSIEEGETQQFSAAAFDASNKKISGKTFTWTSSDETVATINTSGLATAKNAGTTAIAAEVDGISNAVKLTVTEPPPPPPPANMAPTNVGYIQDVRLSNRGSSATRSVSGKFSDPDEDTLTYTVNSPNPLIATVSISGSTVTVAPVAIGSTGKIVVTAMDPGGLTATQDFTATVVNDPPRRVGSISDISLFKNGKTRSIPISGKFSDPNSDTLTYSASSSRTSVATASVSGSTVTVRSRAKGTATITVTAADPYGATVKQTFTVNVINRHPQPQGTIAKMTFHLGEAAKRTGVSDNFRDPDNDVLTFTASSSNTSVATVSVTGSNVEVRPGVLGTARITVTATDPDSLSNTHGFDVEVVNGRPKVKRAIPDKRLNKNGSTSINASNHFSDPEDDEMTFSASSSDTGIVTASASESTVTINSGAVIGSADITVTATDSHNGSVSDTLTVTVRNGGPQVVKSFPEVNLKVGDPPKRFDVSGHFSDDGDSLTYSVDDPNSSIAAVSISGSEVTVDPRSEGTIDKVKVTATDPEGLNTSEDFSVVVGPAPPPPPCPVVHGTNPLSSLSLKVGKSTTIDLSDHFINIETGDTYSYSLQDSAQNAVSLSLDDNELEISADNVGDSGNIIVKITRVGGGADCYATSEFNVEVDSADPPPPPPPCPMVNMDNLVSDFEMEVGDTTTVDVSDYFINIETGDKFKVELRDSTQTAVSLSLTGSQLAITADNAGSSDGITIKAIRGDDEANCSASDMFTVTVTEPSTDPPPPCPMVNTDDPLSTLTMTLGASTTIDLSDHFINVEPGDTFDVSLQDSTQTAVSLSQSGSRLEIDADNPGPSGNIVVKVTRGDDDAGCLANDKFSVTVTPCPTVSTTIPVQDLVVGGINATIRLSSYFDGLSGSTITVSSKDGLVASASRSGTDLTIAPVGEGSTTVTVTVSKNGCTNVVQSISVTVTLCPSISSTIPAQNLVVGGSSALISLSSYFDGLSGSTITVSSKDDMVASASRSGTDLTIAPVGEGSTTVTVTVSKQGCDPVEQSFVVNVTPCPSISAIIPAQQLVVDGISATISLSSYFDGLSGSTITYSSSDSTIASASLMGTDLTIAPKGEGMATVTVTVSKHGCGPVEQSISVTVTPCPLLQSAIEDQMLMIGNDPLEIDLSEHFVIPTDFDPGFMVSSSDAEVATEGLVGNILTVTPVAAGTDTITVTATKTGCDGSVVDEFVVTVLPPCPALIMDSPVPDQVLSIIAGPVTIDLTRYFEYIDHEDTRITVTSPDPTVAVVNLDSTVVTIEPKLAGTLETVEISVARGECVKVTQSFMVTVEDLPGGIWSVSPDGDVYRLEGNVGIGLSGPDQKLVVDGKIKAEEVYLSMIPADYVFEDGYSLMSLEEVAEFIAARGHLPGIASGAEMKARGVGVSEMQTLLLEKIEEVSLYVIAQHEELRAHQDHIASQHRRLELRGQQIRQLESRTERLERE